MADMFPWGNMPITEADPEIADLIEKEKNRQWRGLELIASEVRPVLFLPSLTPKVAMVVSGRAALGMRLQRQGGVSWPRCLTRLQNGGLCPAVHGRMAARSCLVL